MDNVSFTIEEENLICIYHKHDHRRTIAAISDALPDMDADMRQMCIRDRYLSGDGLLVSWCIGHLISMADAGSYDAVSYTHLHGGQAQAHPRRKKTD